ncbi:hypothetical protein N7539_008836 [Penicillium diatomitis]|uniref:Uncharacterized protein n=1 Tax=Penicillium diatomitis TaxID=2819901 RepID=A0A9X0BLY6_9EURO|nr:uncharacterized protein N7539_008836 [Penicillium diatomitis]KAJ5471893.1 hypothetical protein N7539_008836 [Penicillium diatomitis]
MLILPGKSTSALQAGVNMSVQPLEPIVDESHSSSGLHSHHSIGASPSSSIAQTQELHLAAIRFEQSVPAAFCMSAIRSAGSGDCGASSGKKDATLV